jgi:hypothetical protein
MKHEWYMLSTLSPLSLSEDPPPSPSPLVLMNCIYGEISFNFFLEYLLDLKKILMKLLRN